MKERGRVTEIRERLAKIQLEFSAACESCVQGSCSAAKPSLEAWNGGDLELAPGDLVEIEVDTRAASAGALLVFGPPALLFAVGYAAVRALLPGAASEEPAALGGLAGLALGVLLALIVSRRRRQASLPLILRRVEAASPASS
jgi:MYXO-CTERM domain-containing protein